MRSVFLLLVVLALPGCSIWPSAVADDSYAARSEQQRLALDSWVLKARLRTQDKRAHLRWRQQGEEFDVLLRGPFGLGAVSIQGNAQQITIDDGEELRLSTEPTRDIYELTGLFVPVHALSFWLRGLAAPVANFQIDRDELGHANSIEQAGWALLFEDYQDENGIAFPFHIELSQAPWLLDLDVTRWRWP
ncbi:MAG: lipoprotein insertase outer membrane protein LolB [Oceanococcus sp.]